MYDLVVISHIPSFYKVNLYNGLARQLKVFVIFLSSDSTLRTPDFFSDDYRFDQATLFRGYFEHRSIIRNCWALLSELRRLRYRQIIVGSWDLPEAWAALSIAKGKNAVLVESTIFESSIVGWRGLLKRVFLKQVTCAYASGRPHVELLEKLGFKGRAVITGGVGIFNRGRQGVHAQKFSGRFLYVGRLSPEKNLRLLLRVFSKLQETALTIVGSGTDGPELLKVAPKNVTFLGHVSNDRISDIYRAHDVLVLPSNSEPWGLVVDEALNYGLPVIVSAQVGCSVDLVKRYSSGFIFDSDDELALIEAILKMADPQIYSVLCRNVVKIDFSVREAEQIAAYVEAVAGLSCV